jgi:hypothetical protein
MPFLSTGRNGVSKKCVHVSEVYWAKLGEEPSRIGRLRGINLVVSLDD